MTIFYYNLTPLNTPISVATAVFLLMTLKIFNDIENPNIFRVMCLEMSFKPPRKNQFQIERKRDRKRERLRETETKRERERERKRKERERKRERERERE